MWSAAVVSEQGPKLSDLGTNGVAPWAGDRLAAAAAMASPKDEAVAATATVAATPPRNVERDCVLTASRLVKPSNQCSKDPPFEPVGW